MYNAERKLKYLKNMTYDSTRKQYMTFYNKTEPFEEKLGRDLCEFTLSECMSMITVIDPKNDKQARVYCSMINGYRRYVYNNQDNIFADMDKEFYKQFA